MVASGWFNLYAPAVELIGIQYNDGKAIIDYIETINQFSIRTQWIAPIMISDYCILEKEFRKAVDKNTD